MSALEVQIGRASTRCALAAVLPHVGSTETLSRVRFTFESARRLLVSASAGSTAAVARIHVHDVVALPELAVVDLEPRSVREVLAVFTPPSNKDERAMWNEEAFTLRITHDEVSWLEDSPVMEGRSLSVPRLPALGESESSYPDIPGVTARFLDTPPDESADASVNPQLLARFVTSAKAYGDDGLRLEMALRKGIGAYGWTVQVDRDFVGILLPIHRRDTEQPELADTRQRWADRLRPLARPEPRPALVRAGLPNPKES
ncbi:hypothetical protein [Cellulosimicrobium sp. I38E]|uniref:hypothetical protein n=1 Tax=Cellulosimicrobium sp. I38E TaxID=1393139 RepID=UPI0007B2B749|nr:hypothetical protein [Cellulosimicrobium sp. I38E]KZM78383.1 hypothetical protein A0J59_13710 [Cellulosimicrobium sp. I38E]